MINKYKKWLKYVLPTLLLFIDLDKNYFIYLIGSLFFIRYFVLKKKFNELVIAFTLFGYIYCGAFVSKVGGTNLLYLLSGLILLFLYRFFSNWNGIKKLEIKNHFIFYVIFTFFILVVYSMINSYNMSYQNLKINLFFVWSTIFIVAFFCLDRRILTNFDYLSFVIIIYILFIPYFSFLNLDKIDMALSPYSVWDNFSLRPDGLRGAGVNIDNISISRYSGIGSFLVGILLLEFKKKYLFIIPMLFPFLILLITCQTRQGLFGFLLCMLVYLVFYFLNNKSSKLKFILVILMLFGSYRGYLSYLSSYQVETRALSDTGLSGRDKSYEKSFIFFNNADKGIGFGNFPVRLTYKYPHNIFIEVLIEIGLFGTICLMWFTFWLIYTFTKVLRNYKEYSNFHYIILCISLYYFFVAQFSADLPRNMTFIFGLTVFTVLSYNRHLTVK